MRGWKYRGQERPPFAHEPGPGQESVWDYPRPPRIDPDSRRVLVRSTDLLLADSRSALRVLETASPPTFYVPEADVDMDRLSPVHGSSLCEWKGAARYWALRDAPKLGAVAWSYPHPGPRFAALRSHFAFYPGRVSCYVDDERARPQDGGFYGGWVTDELVGPFKGSPGTGHW